MDTFNLLKNKLIKEIDSIAIDGQKTEPPLKNSLKTLVKAYKNNVYTGNSIIYGRKFSIDIPKQFDNLAQLYVKVTLSTGNVASTVQSYFATKIFKYIRIKTKNGLVLQTFNPQYLQDRIDEMYSSPIYSYLQLQVEPDTTFLAGNPTVFVPLFCFFSEHENSMLKVRELEQLEVEFIINDNYSVMGMSASLTSLDTELHCLYHDTNNSNNKRDYEKKTGLPRYLKNSYTIFEEDRTTITSGSTSARLLLRCPHPLFALKAVLVDPTTSNKKEIKNMKISFADKTFLDLDYRINYQNYGVNKAFLPNGTFSYFFNKLKNRVVDSGLVTFTDEMFPVYLDITFDSLSTNYNLYVYEEIRTNFLVSDTGTIYPSDDINSWKEGLKQLNSAQNN